MKLSLKNMMIIIFTILLAIIVATGVVGGLALGNVINIPPLSAGILLGASGLLGALLITMIVLKFIYRTKYKNLSEDEINAFKADSSTLPTSLVLYIVLNPILANKQKFEFESFKLV